MTSTNLDVVRSICAAWERGDFGAVDWADPEIEFVITGGPLEGSWTGLAGMAEGFRHFLQGFDQLRLEVGDYREVDDKRIFVAIRLSGRGKTSGLELDQIKGEGGVGLFYFRRGKVKRYVIYWDREQALAELGLVSEN